MEKRILKFAKSEEKKLMGNLSIQKTILHTLALPYSIISDAITKNAPTTAFMMKIM